MDAITKSVRAFKQGVKEANQPTGREREGKVTGAEMKQELKKLPATEAGLRAANDMLEARNINLTDAARKALKAFIKDNAIAELPGIGDTPRPAVNPHFPRHGMGVRVVNNTSVVEEMLQEPDFQRRLLQAAYPRQDRYATYNIGDIEPADGGFNVIVEEHKRGGQVSGIAVFVDRAGGIAAADGGYDSGPYVPSGPIGGFRPF